MKSQFRGLFFLDSKIAKLISHKICAVGKMVKFPHCIYFQHPLVKKFSDDLTKNPWDPDTFSELCANGMKKQDSDLIKYCDEVSAKEWRILLDYCNNKANNAN